MGVLLKLALYAVLLYAMARLVVRLLMAFAPPPRAPRRPAGMAVEDLAPCPNCGAYVAVSAGPCARPECPRRG